MHTDIHVHLSVYFKEPVYAVVGATDPKSDPQAGVPGQNSFLFRETSVLLLRPFNLLDVAHPCYQGWSEDY